MVLSEEAYTLLGTLIAQRKNDQTRSEYAIPQWKRLITYPKPTQVELDTLIRSTRLEF